MTSPRAEGVRIPSFVPIILDFELRVNYWKSSCSIMVSLVIREATVADIPLIAEVRSGALTEQEIFGFSVPGSGLFYSKGKLVEMWDTGNRLKEGSEVFVASFGRRVIGFIVFNMTNLDDNMDNVVVAKNEQGKGVGKALVRHVEALAKFRGMDFVTTGTTENARGVPWKAYGFWMKMGYEDTGKRLPSGYGFKVIPLVKKLK